MMRTLALVLFALFTTAAQSAQTYEADTDEARSLCERELMSNLPKWRKEALANLTKISPFPLFPVTVSARAEGLIAQALNIKPEQVSELSRHAFKITRDGDRLQLELEGWPNFHRTLVSLRKPEVIRDLMLPNLAPSFSEAVRGNSQLFFPIRFLPHEHELGLTLPLRSVTPGEPGHPPFFAFQIGLLKPCYDDGSGDLGEQIYTGDDGESLCLDPLVTLSTWPETFEVIVNPRYSAYSRYD